MLLWKKRQKIDFRGLRYQPPYFLITQTNTKYVNF